MNVFKSLAYVCCAIVTMASAAAQAQDTLQNGELLEKSGITHQIMQFPAAFEAGAEQARQQGAPIDAKFEKAWRNVTPIAFKPGKILAALDKGLDKLLTTEEKRELLAHFNSPLGKKVADVEKLASEPEAMAKITALAQNPASFADRAALYKELDEAMGATPAMISMVTNMSVALQAGIVAAADNPAKVDIGALKAQIEKQQATVAQQMQAQVAATLAYCYQSLSTDEIKDYLKVVKTPAGQKFNHGMIALMSDAFTVQTKELGQLLYKALETGQPG